MSELIVDFRAGVSEDAARKIVEAAGGTIRRRMGNDDPSRVRLLARIPNDHVAIAIATHASVDRTEENRGDYGAR